MDTPEHDKRFVKDSRELHPEIKLAYAYVDKVRDTADVPSAYGIVWHGWALREAFLAGITVASQKQVDYRAGFNAEIRRAIRHLKRHKQGLPGDGLQRAQEILENADERVSTGDYNIKG